VTRGYLSMNPALIAKPPRLDEEEIEPLSRAEITKLFATALAGRNAARWVIAITLGLRQAMHIMGWSNAALAQRYQHVTGHVLGNVATQVGTHL
jgi:hypothetical protein